MCYFLNTTVPHPTHLGLDVGLIPEPNLGVVSQFATWIYIDTLILKGNIMVCLLLLFRRFLYTILLLSASHILYTAFGAHWDACQVFSSYTYLAGWSCGLLRWMFSKWGRYIRCCLLIPLLCDSHRCNAPFIFPLSNHDNCYYYSCPSKKERKNVLVLSPFWPNRYGCNLYFDSFIG